MSVGAVIIEIQLDGFQMMVLFEIIFASAKVLLSRLKMVIFSSLAQQFQDVVDGSHAMLNEQEV